MNWQNLIKLGREMAAATPSDHLHQAGLRPAVSSAYYAMHHALARSNAGRLSAPRNATCRSGHTGAGSCRSAIGRLAHFPGRDAAWQPGSPQQVGSRLQELPVSPAPPLE